MIRSVDLVRDSGITYRQLDHWIRKGYVTPESDPCPGSGGEPREFSEDEVRFVKEMNSLVKAGMAPACAADLARCLIDIGVAQFGDFEIRHTTEGVNT